MRLPLGQVVATPAALSVGDWSQLLPLLTRHTNGDWGTVSEYDAEQNDSAAEYGDRILSAYVVNGEKVWIITEHDRSVTTILLPSDY